MNNDKIKEAFYLWTQNKITKEERDFAEDGLSLMSTYRMLGFHGGYTSRDEEVAMLKKVIEQAGSNGMALLAEIEQLKKDLKFASDLLNQLELKHYATRYNSDKSTIEQLKADKQELVSMLDNCKGIVGVVYLSYTMRNEEGNYDNQVKEMDDKIKTIDSLIERMKGF